MQKMLNIVLHIRSTAHSSTDSSAPSSQTAPPPSHTETRGEVDSNHEVTEASDHNECIQLAAVRERYENTEHRERKNELMNEKLP